MSRRLWTLLGVVVLGVSVMAVVHAQAPGYVTSSKCKMCHGMMNKQIVEAWSKTPHSKALLVPAEAGAVVADFSNAPFKKEDVKYVLGSGLHMQAYVDAQFKVLPAKWDVAEKKWVPTESVDASTQCIGCHVTGYDAAQKKWAENGVACEACHGPGQAHASSGDKSKIVNPANLKGPEKIAVCARCHSRGKDTTGKFAWPTTWKIGQPIEPAFVLAPIVPGAQNQQFNELKTSKHFAAGVDCTTCHKPHGVDAVQPGQLKKPVNDLCLGCHANIKESKTHPKLAGGMTCATCHMPQGMHTFAPPK